MIYIYIWLYVLQLSINKSHLFSRDVKGTIQKMFRIIGSFIWYRFWGNKEEKRKSLWTRHFHMWDYKNYTAVKIVHLTFILIVKLIKQAKRKWKCLRPNNSLLGTQFKYTKFAGGRTHARWTTSEYIYTDPHK